MSQLLHTQTVALGARSYPIEIGTGTLADAGSRLKNVLETRRAFIVTNVTIAPLYLEKLQQSLAAAGIAPEAIQLPDGEAYKNWDELYKILGWLLEHRAERGTPLLALGGGVIGDITGLAAALYQRGMPFAQIPTTLLAQVDSSVGGKTAVNHPLGKNMIGAFYQPRLVLADLETLNSLPEREYLSGFAEIIKYGAIADAGFFDWLVGHAKKLLARDATALAYAVNESCRVKAETVAADEREAGSRAFLNLGHTFGHTIETHEGYGKWLHGEAVAMGIALAARLSVETAGLPETDAQRLIDCLKRFGLPVEAPVFAHDDWLELMKHDKKTKNGRVRFVLLEALGKAIVRGDVSDETVELVLP
jgi:3-dehydroquinate synthase